MWLIYILYMCESLRELRKIIQRLQSIFILIPMENKTIAQEKVKIILGQNTDEAKNSASLKFPNRGSHSEHKANRS